MPQKIPIVDYNGKQAEMLPTDTIPPVNLGTGTPNGTKFLRDDGVFVTPSGGGGSGTVLSGVAVLNFGVEQDIVLLTVLDSSITNSGVKGVTFLPQETTETSLDDFSLNGVSFNLANIIDFTSFDIIGTSINGASGNYTIKYLIII